MPVHHMNLQNSNFQSFKRRILLCFGYFYLWSAIVNIIGYVLIGYIGPPEPCFPHLTTFSVFVVGCSNVFIESAWNIFIGIPRLLVVPIHVAATMLYSGFRTIFANDSWTYFYFMGAIRWLLLSIPFLMVTIIGYRYLRQSSLLTARIITFALAITIIYDGLTR